MFAIPPVSTGGYYTMVVPNNDFSEVASYSGATESDVSPTGIVGVSSTEPFTDTFLGAVAYLNRSTHIPYYKTPSDTIFKPLTDSDWDSGWRCGSLRSYKDFLVALNVTKGATSYPTMVKWSDITGYGAPPASWDETSTTNSAGENILNEMRDQLIDGLTLRDSFILYGATESWAMDYIGGSLIFRFRKLFDNAGIINQNCVVQIDGVHYVFDRNDIYMHDGATKKSIVHGANKDFIFEGLRSDLTKYAFVTHNPVLNEIYFCYASDDAQVGFSNPSGGCNRAYVYNYRRGIGSFVDLANVTGSCLGSLETGDTWTSIDDVSWEDMGGTWSGAEDDKGLLTLFTGPLDTTQGLTKNRLYGFDLITGGRLVAPIETEALKDAYIERVGIDLDEVGANLTLYKALHAIYPQHSVSELPSGTSFGFGGSSIVGQEPNWSDYTTYTPTTDNKIDVRETGRYLAYRMLHTGSTDFALSGFDIKVTLRGRRG
ncbi:hypothetical protein BSL82_03435 [Tardibacter chloracetimidivorans]|uniref:Uncharacterized protein n=2 Tax=Tardibacter chloracetimidivorans TaxID=1921510 RepID=A0A1L3ZS84_9SPHN|nr:hypothetical protein BSL82_03435 [Tardibacter chloracetimidivorans]